MTAIKKALSLSNHYFKNNQGGAELQMIYLAEGLAKKYAEKEHSFLNLDAFIRLIEPVK